jgi:hypothetical protein
MKRQGGLLLLPVALALSIMGALAYSMGRGGAQEASAVDAQYDTEVARYLAEAGLRLAKWQNEKIGCDSERRFANVRLPGVAGTVTVDALRVDKERFSATVTATSARGAVDTLARNNMMFYDRTREYDTTLPNSAFQDTYISSVSPASSHGNSGTLEATDGKAHILLDVSLSSIPNNARPTKAALFLYLDDSDSVQTVRELAAHAVTRGWTDGSASWIFPWLTSPGGSYDARPEFTATIGAAKTWYRWDLGPLVRRWADNRPGNFGILFKPLGLNTARFNSIDADGNRPRMDVSYHQRCK